jgi:hypothetical protein
MNIFGYQIATRIIAMIVGGLLIVGILAFGVTQCDKRRNEAAQGRVDSAQGQAQSNSAADAIGTVTRRGAEDTASEDLTRINEREIRAAPGAGDRVNAGVNAAGLAALCKRQAYKNTERCRIFRKDRQ